MTAIDASAVAARLARALAASRAYREAGPAVGAVLAETLPALGADFALVLDARGRAVASAGATAAGLALAADDPGYLERAGAAALAGGAGSPDEDVAALPIRVEGEMVGALVLQAESPMERPGFAGAVQLLASCIGDLLRAPPPRRKRADATAERLARSLASHGDGVALFGADGGLIMANPAFAAAHGAAVEALRGLTLEEILRRSHDGFGPLLLARDLSAAGAELALAADGRWLRLSRCRADGGDELVLQSAADDAVASVADARRRIRAATAEAEARRDVCEALPVGLLLLSETGRIVEANAEATRLLRASQEDLTGRRLGRMARAVGEDWTPVGRARGHGERLAAKARRFGGDRMIVALVELPAPAEPDRKAEQAWRVFDPQRALSELGHEMRTPLNAVIGFADIMLARSFGPVNDRQAQYLSDIAGAGRHMLEMVDHMLNHAQLASGRYPFHPEWVRIDAVATEAMRLQEPAAAYGQVTLSLGPANGIEVNVDRGAMLQVLTNLLTNAVKFTPPGGRVDLSVEQAADGLYIRVADTGEGIPPEDLPRVMEPFTQARRLGGRPLKGAGLGLSIVQALTELHGGEVTLRSEPGQGVEATVRLPPERARRAIAPAG